MLMTTIPFCQAQIPAGSKKVIALQSVPGNASIKLLSESKEILARRLTSIGLRNADIALDTAKSQLVITVGDTVSYETLSGILLVQGNVCFKADSVLVLTREDILEVHADLDNPKQPALCITFKETDWKVWENMTVRNLNKPVALTVDNNVYCAPRIMDTITHGRISLTGDGLTKTGVGNLVAILSSGPVPLKFTNVSKH